MFFVASLIIWDCKALQFRVGSIIKSLKSKLNMINDNFPESFYKSWGIDVNTKRPSKPPSPIPVKSLHHLRQLISEGYRVQDLDVRGNLTDSPIRHNTNTSVNGDNNSASSVTDMSLRVHPVIKALYDRSGNKSIPGARVDGRKIAISIGTSALYIYNHIKGSFNMLLNMYRGWRYARLCGSRHGYCK